MMHETWPSLKVMLSSGYSAFPGSSGAPREGLVGFIQKPYLPGELLEAVQKAFEP
jgi:FixJ family two-component response regulator